MILEDVFVVSVEDLEDEMRAEDGFLFDWTKTHFGAQNDCVLVVLFLVVFEPRKRLGGQYEPEFFRATLWKNKEENEIEDICTSHHAKIIYVQPSFSNDHVFGLLVWIFLNLSGGVGSSLCESDKVFMIGIYVGSFVREQVIDILLCFHFLFSNVSTKILLRTPPHDNCRNCRF
jgi:hypothetical protein